MIEKNELNKNAMGGTELMQLGLIKHVKKELLDDFQIIASRVRDIDSSRIPILWLHDLSEDPEVRNLAEPLYRKKFGKLVFVSQWQFTSYNKVLGVPYNCSTVLQNAIEPIPEHTKKNDGVIRLIYHTTPHRGLDGLLEVYSHLSKEYGTRIHLDVYSSFKIYGWQDRDEHYKHLFDYCENHPHITYHGSVSNNEIRIALQNAHIFAYPCVWPETSCIAAIEAMSAKCLIVCPKYAALPETTAGFAMDYDFNDIDLYDNLTNFYNSLKWSIENIHKIDHHLNMQKRYIDGRYDWELRGKEWTKQLELIKMKWGK